MLRSSAAGGGRRGGSRLPAHPPSTGQLGAELLTPQADRDEVCAISLMRLLQVSGRTTAASSCRPACARRREQGVVAAGHARVSLPGQPGAAGEPTQEAEGLGVSAFQAATGPGGVNADYLRWQGIAATAGLAASPNAKLVFIGGRNGLPLILNTDAGLGGQLSDRPAAAGFAGCRSAEAGTPVRLSVLLPQALTRRLRTLAASVEASLAQAFAAVIATYLHRLGGGRDLLLRLPTTGRLGAELRRTAGMATNLLPVRLAVTPQTSTLDVLRQAAQAIGGGLRHQRYRHEDRAVIWGCCGEPDAFGPGVNVQSFDYALRFGGYPAEAHNLANGTRVQDLDISVYDRRDGRDVRVDLDGNPALHDAASLQTHGGPVVRLPAAMAADPKLPVGRLEVLAREERELLVVRRNATAAPVPAGTVVELLQGQARGRPLRRR